MPDYQIVGTKKPYSGRVIKIGDIFFTTIGGGIEGDRQELEETSSTENPVVRLFNAPNSPRYRKPNGELVNIGNPLHEHQDGTIMTKHNMQGAGTSDESVVVTAVASQSPMSENNNIETRTNVDSMDGNTITPLRDGGGY